MRSKQAERRERERAEEVDREKQRRKHGQELQQVRQKLQDDEMKKLADQRRKEKMEDKLARWSIFEKRWTNTNWSSFYDVADKKFHILKRKRIF